MERIGIFIYNLVLIMVYSGIIWMSFLLFMNGREKILLWTGIIFSAVLMDDMVIFLSEMFVHFADVYNKLFMIVPTYKTLIYLILSLGYLNIFQKLLNRRIMGLDYGILAFYVIFMLFVPALKNSSWKIWLYFLPSQLFNTYVAARSFFIRKKNPEQFQGSFYRWCKRLFMITIFLNLLVIAEDTIVIFNFDTYSTSSIIMNNRSFTSDLLYITHAGFTTAYLMDYLKVMLRNNRIVSAVNRKSERTIPSDIEDSLLYHFSEAYHLTSREREILKVLLLDKTNQDISDILCISLGTAKTHVHNIFQKIGVVKRPQLLEVYEQYRIKELKPETTDE
ncbi:helix-turn-helix domain-containing protein [Lacrimispora sp. JR3]|uniref:helix-turn-helix domain-containing protein n=1 Tax=Lacrimispora sinapis TaxID=3111456 RepID=UPI0037496C03